MRIVKILGSVLALVLALAWVMSTGPADASSDGGPNVEQAAGSEDLQQSPFDLLATRQIEPDELLRRAFSQRGLPNRTRDIHGNDVEVLLLMESLTGEKAEAVETLLKRWDADGNESQARFARDTLVSWGKSADSIEAIKRALSDDDPQVRIAGCRRLKRMGPLANEALAELEGCLEHSWIAVRWDAIEAVEATRLVAALPKVRECMRPLDFQDPDNLYVSLLAAKTVAILDESDTEGLKVLNEIALRSDELVRDVLLALEDIGPRSIHAKEGLARLFVIGDPVSWVTLQVRMTLGNMRESASLIMQEWLSPSKGSPALRQRTLEYLSSVGPDSKPDMYMREGVDLISLYEPVAKYLGLSDQTIRTLVLQSLINIEARTDRKLATEVHVRKAALIASEAEELRIPVADYLARHGDDHRSIVFPALRKLANDKSPYVRAAAANALSKLDDRDETDRQLIIETCFGVLEEFGYSVESFDRNTRVTSGRARDLAVDVLQQMRPAKTELPRMLALFEVSSGRHLPQVVATLGNDAVPSLLVGLEHKNDWIRARYIESLGMTGSPQAVEPLVSLLASDDREVALLALSNMPEQCGAHVPRLINLLSEEWSRDYATQILSGLGSSASDALPVLVGQPVRRGARFATIPRSAALNARAVAQIGQGTDQELLGIRNVLAAIGVGYSWRYDGGDNVGYSETIDLIVELGGRARPLIPVLSELVEDHELLNPLYRFEAAFALVKLEPNNPRWLEHVNRIAKQLEDDSTRGSIVEARIKQL